MPPLVIKGYFILYRPLVKTSKIYVVAFVGGIFRIPLRGSLLKSGVLSPDVIPLHKYFVGKLAQPARGVRINLTVTLCDVGFNQQWIATCVYL
jgi:hypothetical protein